MISAAGWQGWTGDGREGLAASRPGQAGDAGEQDGGPEWAGRRRGRKKGPSAGGRKGRELPEAGGGYLQQSSTLKKAAAPAPHTGQDSTGP